MKRRLVEEVFNRYAPIDTEATLNAFNSRMQALGFEDVACVEVDYDEECNTFVTFEDTEGNQLDVTFCDDPDEGIVGIVGEEDDDFVTLVDLDALSPQVEETMYGTFVNLTDLTWMNTSAFEAIFTSGDLDFDADDQHDEYGMVADPFNPPVFEALDEARKIAVIRGGKRVRLAVVRKKRKKVLTGRQRSAIRSAVRKRKMKKSKINRKRKRSLSVRKRMHLKTPKLSKFQKIAGGANRKR